MVDQAANDSRACPEKKKLTCSATECKIFSPHCARSISCIFQSPMRTAAVALAAATTVSAKTYLAEKFESS
jgi:hypothetical protein